MKRAVIDLGTNTALLLIADEARRLHDEERIIGLGRGLEREGRISAGAVERAREALLDYVRVLREKGVVQVRAVGTAVFRAAGNAAEVQNELERETGVSLRIISGDEEAALVYLAAARTFPGNLEKTVIDIGGGSTEIIEGRGEERVRLTSLPVGAVRLTERFIHRFPAPAHEIKALREFLRQTLSENLKGFGSRPGQPLVGTAGTFTTAAALVQGMKIYDPEKITGFKLQRGAVEEWLLRLSGMTIEEQREVPGLKPARAGVVLGGISLILSLYEYFGAEEIVVSDAGLRYGVLYQWMEEDGDKKKA